jgi:hypothetical protein
MLKTIYLSSVVLVLFVSGVWHLTAPELTERWITRTQGIRIIGALLLELSIPCVAWGGSYYWMLWAGLTASGFMRLCYPKTSLRTLRQNYPVWVQGCLLVEGATLVWALRP